MNDRNAIRQTANMPRGKIFSVNRSDAAIPTMTTPSRKRSLADHQNTVGAYQNQALPKTCATWAR